MEKLGSFNVGINYKSSWIPLYGFPQLKMQISAFQQAQCKHFDPSTSLRTGTLTRRQTLKSIQGFMIKNKQLEFNLNQSFLLSLIILTLYIKETDNQS